MNAIQRAIARVSGIPTFDAASEQHANELFDQATPIALANDGILESKAGMEYAAVVGKSDLASGQGLPMDVPILRDKTLLIIEEMMLDDAVGTYIELKKIAALSTPWSIQPANDDPASVLHAEFITDALTRMRGSLRQKLREVLSALQYGFSVTNIVTETIEQGQFKGKIGLRDLKTKPPDRIFFDTDEFLNIKDDGILYRDPDGQLQRFKRSQFVVYSYRGQFGNPYGFSDCIRAHDRWNSKRWVMKFWDIFLERHGCGTWIAQWAKTDVPPPTERATVLAFLNRAQARSGLMVSDRWTITPHEANPGSTAMFSDAIDARSTQIARAIFLPDLTGFSEKAAGAYALGKKHFDFLLMILTNLQEDLADEVMGEQVIRPLIDLNFGEQDAYPQFVFEPLTTEQKEWWLTSVVAACEKGILTPDEDIKNRVRKALDLPEQEETDVPDEPQPDQQPQQPGENPFDPQPDPEQEPAPDDAEAEDDPEFSEANLNDMDLLLEEIGKHDRVIVVGGPRCGKTMLAVASAYKHARAHRHTDSLVGVLPWDKMSEEVSRWLSEPGRWVVEGVATVRALRKWLAEHPGQKLDATVLLMEKPQVKRKRGQQIMAKGVKTVWAGIEDDLKARGVQIVRA